MPNFFNINSMIAIGGYIIAGIFVLLRMLGMHARMMSYRSRSGAVSFPSFMEQK